MVRARGNWTKRMEISNFFSCFFCLCVLSFFLIVKTATNKQTKGTFLFPSSDEGEVKREHENNNVIDICRCEFFYAII